jgi:hypothetical protein
MSKKTQKIKTQKIKTQKIKKTKHLRRKTLKMRFIFDAAKFHPAALKLFRPR